MIKGIKQKTASSRMVAGSFLSWKIMIRNNEPDQKIADYTDLSIAQIQQIRGDVD